jgi:hypothetical protein
MQFGRRKSRTKGVWAHLSNGVFLRTFRMLRLKFDGARFDKLLCLGHSALGDGNIHAGCFDSVTINNGVVDLFPLFRGWFSFH